VTEPIPDQERRNGEVIRSGVTAVVDQGGAAPVTIQGFRKFIKDRAATRVYAFVSNYPVGAT
jgi:dihydroorotase